MNIKSSAQWISNEKVGKYETEFHAIARINQLLDFPMEHHIHLTKCHFMGENMVYLGLIVHAKHIIAKEKMITGIHNVITPRNIHEEGSYQGLAWLYIPPLVTTSAMLTVVIHCTSKIETQWTGELQVSLQKITNILCTPRTLLQNFRMHFQVCCDVYTTRVQALLFQAWIYNNMEEVKWWRERGKGVTTNDMWKCKERISNPTYRKLAKIKYNLQHISVWNPGTSNIFNIIHRYELTENEENSRTSSFEEGVPDAG